MGQHWLAGPEAKLRRAIEHLDTLERECDRFLKSEPYTVTTKFESDAGCYIARFRERKSLPLAASIVVGELIHNLRSALEHVAWALAASNIDRPENLWKREIRDKITFPVAKSPEAFDSHSLMPFITDAAKAALDPLQPHTRRHPYQIARHPLVALHELWNIDKHRVVHGGIGEIDLSTTSWVPTGIRIEELAQALDIKPLEISGPLEDQTPIAEVRFPALVNPPGTTKVQMKGQPTARVLFGAGDRAASQEGLQALCAYVAAVLNEVAPILPDRA